MTITNYLYGKHTKGFCTTSYHEEVTTSFAFPFHQSFLLKNHYNLFGVTNIWQAYKVLK